MGPYTFSTRATVAAAMAGLFMTTGALAADWPGKAKWDKVVAAAKKEGKLVVAGPSGRAWRGVLVKFQEAYPEWRLTYDLERSLEEIHAGLSARIGSG